MLNMAQKSHKHRGLTLFELMITLSLIGIILSIAIPSFLHYRSRHEFSQLVYLMHSQINLARSHALTTHNTVVLCSSLDLQHCTQQQWHRGLLLYVDNNNNRQRDENEKVISSVYTNLKYGHFTWHGNASHPHTVVFQSDSGLPRGSMGHFSYCNFDDQSLQQDLPLGAMGHLHAVPSTQC